MGAESCEKSESFVATFGRKLWSITLFLHARYGAMKVLCTGLVEFGGVLVENSKGTHSWRFSTWKKKAQVTPTRGQKIEHAAPLPHAQLGTLHTTQSAQLVPTTSMYGTQSGGIRQSACAANRTHARPHGRIWDHLKRVWRFGARSGFDEGHAVSASSMGLSRHNRGREEGERRSL